MVFKTAQSAQLDALMKTPLFNFLEEPKDQVDQVTVAYERARAIAKIYNFTAKDIGTLQQKYWDLHRNMMSGAESSVFTILTVHYNLACGTLVPHAAKRPDLQPLLKQVLDFDVIAVYLLTEVGHGIDARHIETTATLLPNGEFDFHSPTPEAAKFMPSSMPVIGLKKVGIVMARLVVNGQDKGLRPFVVPMNDGTQMNKGVTCRLLPKRTGRHVIDHCITSFNHVRLPRGALLGDFNEDPRKAFTAGTARIAIGSLSLSLISIPVLSITSYIAAKYSMRRTVVNPAGQTVPIWSFRTQQLPILHGIAQAAVARAYTDEVTMAFRQLLAKQPIDDRALIGFSVSVKAGLLARITGSISAIGERCGSQSLFAENQMIAIQNEMKGAIIAEGDVLTVSIKLATDILQGKTKLPASRHPNCLLAKHEAGMMAECQEIYKKCGSHKTEDYNRYMLPRAIPLVESIGHRMAYEAALDAGVDKALVDLYEAGIVKIDPCWYSENAGVSRAAQADMEDLAVTAAVPQIEKYLADSGAEPYARATPMLTADNWTQFVNGLEVFGGTASYNVIADVYNNARL